MVPLGVVGWASGVHDEVPYVPLVHLGQMQGGRKVETVSRLPEEPAM